jgi:hypothetical protein
MSELIASKEYPQNFPSDAIKIMEAMSFTKHVKVLGSMAIRSQQYAGDYDLVEEVNVKYSSNESALEYLAKRFKEIIKHLQKMPNVFIGDIKAGIIEEWRILPKEYKFEGDKVIGYSADSCKTKIDELLKKKIITQSEANEAKVYLKQNITPLQFLEAKDVLKFHIIRWTPPEVLKGYKIIRGGYKMTLEKAFSSPSIVKLDVIGFVQNNKYTDFSIIYQFKNNDTILNKEVIDVEKSLRENIYYYFNTKNPFKALKRIFALAKYKEDLNTVKLLSPILNSDLGRIYSIISDLGTLDSLLEDYNDVSLDKIKFEIDQFIGRLSNVYHIQDFLNKEHVVLKHIGLAKKSKTKSEVLSHINHIHLILQDILTKATNEIIANLDSVNRLKTI